MKTKKKSSSTILNYSKNNSATQEQNPAQNTSDRESFLANFFQKNRLSFLLGLLFILIIVLFLEVFFSNKKTENPIQDYKIIKQDLNLHTEPNLNSNYDRSKGKRRLINEEEERIACTKTGGFWRNSEKQSGLSSCFTKCDCPIKKTVDCSTGRCVGGKEKACVDTGGEWLISDCECTDTEECDCPGVCNCGGNGYVLTNSGQCIRANSEGEKKCQDSGGNWEESDEYCWTKKELCDSSSGSCNNGFQTSCNCSEDSCLSFEGLCIKKSYISQYITCGGWYPWLGKWNFEENKCDCNEDVAMENGEGGCMPKNLSDIATACTETGGRWDEIHYLCNCKKDEHDYWTTWSHSDKGCVPSDSQKAAKPVIYLYSQQKQDVSVKLDYQGRFTVTYPEYKNGWNVTAYPDSKIINKGDNKEYSYLFWEGEGERNYDLSKGFVIEGEKTSEFLQDKLSKLGLTPKEYNEFIVYWMPKMLHNKYNLIHFASKEEYDDKAVLDINPRPDSILRVFMVFRPLETKINVTPQEIKPFERKGFTVVEWGGTELE